MKTDYPTSMIKLGLPRKLQTPNPWMQANTSYTERNGNNIDYGNGT